MTMHANINRELRRRIYRRDGWRCALCDSTRYLQIHHVIPRGQGGPREEEMNLITLCADCQALAHGMNLRDLADFDGPGDPERAVNQAMIEYLADLYAERGVLWNPWGKSYRLVDEPGARPP